MGNLTRKQKLILLVLAILDFAVICGLVGLVVNELQRPVAPLPTYTPSPAPIDTPEVAPTWTPTITPTPRPTLPAQPTRTPTPTSTPRPTETPTQTPTPVPLKPVTLEGPDFDFVMPNRIPGWDWDAYVNYRSGEDFDPENSYAEPLFTRADDPARQIDGATLKVETQRWLKFRTWVHQTITAPVGSEVTFEIKAKAFSSIDSLIVKAGIDPTGAENCFRAEWGPEMRINQDSGTVTLVSPSIIVEEAVAEEEEEVTPTPMPHGEEPEEEGEGEEEGEADEEPPPPQIQYGKVTVCFFAEPVLPHVNNAAFFDQARLTVKRP